MQLWECIIFSPVFYQGISLLNPFLISTALWMWKPNTQLKKCLHFNTTIYLCNSFCCPLLGSFPNTESKHSTHALFLIFVTWQTTCTFPQHSPTWLCLAIHLNILFLHLKIPEDVLPPFWHTSWLVIYPICSVINLLHNRFFSLFIYTADAREPKKISATIILSYGRWCTFVSIVFVLKCRIMFPFWNPFFNFDS